MCTSRRGGVYTGRGGGGTDPATEAHERTEKKDDPGCTHGRGGVCISGVVENIKKNARRSNPYDQTKTKGRPMGQIQEEERGRGGG